jgi:hypothetical protein
MRFLLFLLFWSLFPLPSKAEKLTEAGIYHRCHAQFTRSRAKVTDPLLQAVKTGELKGADACGRLLEGFSLPGKIPESKRDVFEAFLAFHSSWFPLRDFLVNGTEGASSAYYDSNEMAYHVNVALFSHGRFDEIVTSPHTFVAEREGSRKPTHFADPDFRGRFRKISGASWAIDGGTPWSQRMVEHGRIKALSVRRQGRSSPVKNTKGNFSLSTSGTFGAGLLGTDTYLLLNSNQAAFEPSDNATLSHRRWGKSIMRDLLCRDIPAIRLSDAEPFVAESSKVPFRRNAECMRCHATMDPLADGARHIMEIRPDGAMHFDFEPRILGSFVKDRPARPSKDPDDEFHRRPPDGRLYFRDSQGGLVDRRFSGLRSLGLALADTEDFYICAAKRYFQFMTGIDVKMDDYSEIPLSAADRAHLKYRAYVQKLGHDLKNHQSLKKLVASILHSKFYALADYGVSE